ALVGINTDSIHVVLVSSVKRPNTAATGNLEDDIGLVLADLALSNVFTFCRCCEVIRVVDEHVDTRVDLLSAELVAGNVASDSRNRQPTDRGNGVVTKQIRDFAL